MTGDERAGRLLKLRSQLDTTSSHEAKAGRYNGHARVLGSLVLELCDAMLEQLDGSADDVRGADRVRVSLSRADAELVAEALDSHAYWQLSDDTYRRDGYVIPPGSDDDKAVEIRRVLRIADRVRASFKDGGEATG